MMSKSKLGIHQNFCTEPDRMRDFVRETHPAAVKVLNLGDVEFPAFVVSESPETLLWGRKFVGSQPLGNPLENARWMAGRILGSSAVRLGLIKIVEGYNEIGPHPTHEYMIFQIELARLLHEAGLKYVAESWSVGVPDIPEWESSWILEVLRVADYIGVHEYCAPAMNDPRGLDPSEPGTGWFTLRYRKWYPNLPDDCKKPLLISECGIDSGACHWDPGAQGGWRSFTDPAGYMRQLKWYDSFLQQDDYVAGSAIFCWGTLDPKWGTFDLAGEASDLLKRYLIEQDGDSRPEPAEKFIGDTMQAHLIPAVPGTAFQRYADLHGFGCARSREVGYGGEIVYRSRPILAQVFMPEWDLSRQYHVCVYLDDPRPWDVKVWHFVREN